MKKFFLKSRNHNLKAITLLTTGMIVQSLSISDDDSSCMKHLNYLRNMNIHHYVPIITNDSDNNYNKSSTKIVEMENELRKVLNDDQIDLDYDERESKSKPWSSYHQPDMIPSLILYPENTENVSQIAKICYKYNIPILPYGGGTSLEGQTLPTTNSKDNVPPISLNFERMKQVIKFNEEDLDITVQAGLGYIELNDWLNEKKSSLWFPLDPGPGATVGGMCACRCSGSTAVKYGSMRENVLYLTVVTPDGDIVKTGSRARKSSAGYDMTRLYIGSEGTLGIVTEACLKLHPRPISTQALILSFDDELQASRAARDFLGNGVGVARCELLDKLMVDVINAGNSTNPNLWPSSVLLLVEVAAISDTAATEQAQFVKELAMKQGAHSNSSIVSGEEALKDLWRRRKECLWNAIAFYPNREPMITDVCVPLSELPIIMKESRQWMEESGLPCPVVAHAGDGNFHVFIMFDPSSKEEVIKAKLLAKKMANRAIDLGGTCTGEHGIGVGKKELLKKELGNNGMEILYKVKTALDPDNIMNPGKVFDIKTKERLKKNDDKYD